MGNKDYKIVVDENDETTIYVTRKKVKKTKKKKAKTSERGKVQTSQSEWDKERDILKLYEHRRRHLEASLREVIKDF